MVRAEWLNGTGRSASIAAASVIGFVLVNWFVACFYMVPSGSMEPTANIGDRIVVTKIGEPARGDIIAFIPPAEWGVGLSPTPILGWLNPPTYLKRVVGLPGDHVAIDASGQVTINGIGLDEPYAYSAESVPVDIRVPEGRVFVLGDNRGNSADSRSHMDYWDGTVSLDAVEGVARARVWPNMGTL